jgi:hypothetical protein
MVVLETFPKLAIIALKHEKVHKFTYKNAETFYGRFLRDLIFFYSFVTVRGGVLI